VNKIIEERRLPAVQIDSIAEGDESPVPPELSPTGDDEVPDQPAA